MRTKVLIGVVLTLTLSVASRAQTPDTAKLDQLLDRLAEKNKGIGRLTLAKDGRVVYDHSFGGDKTDVNGKRLLTPDAKYRIASITKTFTAVMVFQLVEEGKLRLTDTLDKFFPQVPNAARITIAQILAHRSGIANLVPDGSWGLQPRTKDEMVARIAEGQPEFEPDARFGYSNSGYHLLGYIIEKAGGKPYQEALTDRITSRIGLPDTYLGTGNTNPARNEAVSYRYIGGWQESREVDSSVTAGAGAILSTTTDMAKFIHALFEGKLVSQNSFKQMTTMRDGEGMGLVTFSFAGRTLYGNTGGSGSSGAWMAYFPEEKLALAYTTNGKIYPVTNIVSGIFDIYWNRPFQIPTFDTFDVRPEILQRYAGAYSIPGAPAKAMVTTDGTTLYFQPPGEQKAVPLEATAEDTFKIEPFVVFEFDAAKGQMTITRAGQVRVLVKDK